LTNERPKPLAYAELKWKQTIVPNVNSLATIAVWALQTGLWWEESKSLNFEYEVDPFNQKWQWAKSEMIPFKKSSSTK